MRSGEAPYTKGQARFAVTPLRFHLAPGFTLAAEAIGPEHAPRVLLVHGGAQSRRSWARGMRHLAEAGYRAIAVDVRGHGESDWAPDGKYAVDHWAEDMKRLVVELGREDPRPIAVVGASRGGQSGLIAAVEHPERVSSVVLIDITARTDRAGVERLRGFLQRSALGFRTVTDAVEALGAVSALSGRLDPAGLRRMMREDASGLLFWHWDPRLASDEFVSPAYEPALVEAAARRVTQPVLLIRGGESELVRPEHVAHFREILPAVEFVEVPGIGHMLTGDANDAFTPPILEFLARHHPVGR